METLELEQVVVKNSIEVSQKTSSDAKSDSQSHSQNLHVRRCFFSDGSGGLYRDWQIPFLNVSGTSEDAFKCLSSLV